MTAENSEESSKTNKNVVVVPGSTANIELPREITEIFEFLNNINTIIFKSQQIDDPELENEEKIILAREIYLKNRQTFLLRFGSHLQMHHLHDFAQNAIYEDVSPPLRSDESYEEMQIMLLDYKKKLETRERDIKNRRFAVMQKLLANGEYFSEQETMKRAPELYQTFIGQYLSENEIKQRDSYDTRNTTFSGILMHTFDQKDVNKTLSEVEENSSNNFEDPRTNFENNENEDEVENAGYQWGSFDNEKRPCSIRHRKKNKKTKKNITKIATPYQSSSERDILRKEFMDIMQERFLAGKDEEFNYNTVDDDSTLDDLRQLNQDEEDAYFDESDEEENIRENENGEQQSDDDLDIYMQHLQNHITQTN